MDTHSNCIMVILKFEKSNISSKTIFLLKIQNLIINFILNDAESICFETYMGFDAMAQIGHDQSILSVTLRSSLDCTIYDSSILANSLLKFKNLVPGLVLASTMEMF